MCNTIGTSRHVSTDLQYNDLIKPTEKRPRYIVMVPPRPRTYNQNYCQKVSVVDFCSMKLLPERACVKGHKLPSGCALCFGEFEGDCPFIFQSGGDGKNTKTINIYDILLDKWHKLGDLNGPHSRHKMHCVDKQLIVLGGIGNGLIEMYDLASVKNHNTDTIVKGRRASVKGCLKVSVHNYPSIVFEDKIYLYGGISDYGPVRFVQYFNIENGSVGQLPDLPCECHGGVAVIICDIVYIATPQGLLVRFDPATGESKLCNQQPFCRKNFAAVQKCDKLWLFGGETVNGENNLPDCSYDPMTDTWAIEQSRHPTLVSETCVVEYSKSSLFNTPFRKDPFTVTHRCKSVKS